MRMGAYWFAFAVFAALGSACGDDAASSSGQTVDNCEPGTLVPCECDDGSQGTLTCSENPAIQGSCQCAGQRISDIEVPQGPTIAPVDFNGAGTAGMPADMQAPALPAAAADGGNSESAQPAWPSGFGQPGSDDNADDAAAGDDSPDRTDDTTSMEPAEAPEDADTGGGGDAAAGDAVPEGEHCMEVASWDGEWSQFEQEVLLLSNEARAVGHNCDSQGEFGPTEPLTMSAALRCSARLHALDMGVNNYFAHDSQDGSSPGKRITAAGYTFGAYGENIAQGQTSPRQVVDGWLDSDGHCSNLMNPIFTEIGIGFWEAAGSGFARVPQKFWVQNFGTPGGGFGRR